MTLKVQKRAGHASQRMSPSPLFPVVPFVIRLGLWISGNNREKCPPHHIRGTGYPCDLSSLLLTSITWLRGIGQFPHSPVPISPFLACSLGTSPGAQPEGPDSPPPAGGVFATACGISPQQSLVCFSPSPLASTGTHACSFYVLSNRPKISVLETERMFASD